MFPTMPAALGVRNFGDFAKMKGFPKIDLSLILHGEEEIEIRKQMKADGTKYVCEQRFLDFQDKGKMTIVVVEKLFKEVTTGEVYVRMIDHTVLRGFGGFGYKGIQPSVLGSGKVDRPSRQPDFTAEEPTLPNQAIVYRLNGDTNPLHIDPNVAG